MNNRTKNPSTLSADFLFKPIGLVYHHALRVYLITEGAYHQPQAAFSFRNRF